MRPPSWERSPHTRTCASRCRRVSSVHDRYNYRARGYLWCLELLRTLWANLSLPEVAQTLPSSPNLGLFLLRLPNSIANPFRIRPSRLQCLFDSATTDRTASFCHRMPRRDEP